MTFGRTTVSALVLCLAFPALSSELVDLPPPPEPAELVITQADLDGAAREERAPIDLELAMPALPQPAPVTLDEAGPSLAEAPAAPAPDVATTAALSPAPPALAAPEPVAELPASSTADLAAAMPPLPEAAPVELGDIALAPAIPPAAQPAPLPALAEPTRAASAAPEASPAPARQPDLAPLIAARIASAVRQGWLPEREQQAVLAAYEARIYAPLWHDGSALSQAGERVRAQLGRAAEDGLRPADYAFAPGASPADIADADIRLSLLAVRYARDARGGRIDPRRLSGLITPKLELPSAAEVLAGLSTSPDPAAALAAWQPAHEGYRALRDRLAEIRREARPAASPQVRIPAGPVLRPGMRDDRIALIRARFGFGSDDSRVYDRSLATVVAEFQRENGLPANGILTRATQAALNGETTDAREADLIAVMERWRWLPASLGPEHLIVNVPEYLVRKVEGGAVVHEARVVVGKAERPTPIFSDMMDHLVVNPSWTIPPTILRKDYLPKLAADPGYAERKGMQVIRRGNNITIRQPPGPSNALGNIKFMFPNDHAVYLHDTPSRNLFASARRAYSSGCVRVEQPMKLASMVLGGRDEGWSEQRLQGMVGSGERTIKLTRKLPIHIVYMTHVIDGSSQLRTFEDIYGFHRRTREALGL